MIRLSQNTDTWRAAVGTSVNLGGGGVYTMQGILVANEELVHNKDCPMQSVMVL